MATRTVTKEELKNSSTEEESDPFHTNNSISKEANAMEEISQNLNTASQSTYQNSKSFSCFIKSNKETRHFWKTPMKIFHIAVRELSVLLILIETLILLGGYLMILGVHHSIRYCLSKLRHKAFPHEEPSYVRNYYLPARPPVPRRVPRGRMAGG